MLYVRFFLAILFTIITTSIGVADTSSQSAVPIEISLYNLEYQTIPITALNSNVSLDILANPSQVLKYNYTDAENDIRINFDIENIRTSSYASKNNNRIILYEFPEPSEVPLLKYCAIIIGEDDRRIFTFEKSYNTEWILGEITLNSHNKITDTAYFKTPEEFIGYLADYLQIPLQ